MAGCGEATPVMADGLTERTGFDFGWARLGSAGQRVSRGSRIRSRVRACRRCGWRTRNSRAPRRCRGCCRSGHRCDQRPGDEARRPRRSVAFVGFRWLVHVLNYGQSHLLTAFPLRDISADEVDTNQRRNSRDNDGDAVGRTIRHDQNEPTDQREDSKNPSEQLATVSTPVVSSDSVGSG